MCAILIKTLSTEISWTLDNPFGQWAWMFLLILQIDKPHMIQGKTSVLQEEKDKYNLQ